MNATIKLFLDTRRLSTDGIVRLLVTFKRKQKLFTTNVKVNATDWAKLQRNIDEHGLSSKLRDKKFVELYTQLYDENSILQRAKNIIAKLGSNFAFEDFKYQLNNDVSIEKEEKFTSNVVIAIQNKNKAMIKEDRIGSARGYSDVAGSLTRFILSLSDNERFALNLPIEKRTFLTGKRVDISLSFEQITVDFLKEYEKWMLKSGKASQKKDGVSTGTSTTTVGIYLRQLRVVYNEAIVNGVVSLALYPFSKKGYVIPSGRNEKKSLTKEDVKKIMAYEAPPNSFEERSRDLWVFSYLSNGMNFSDICRLTWGDVTGNHAKFVRKKTMNSKKADQKKYQLPCLLTVLQLLSVGEI